MKNFLGLVFYFTFMGMMQNASAQVFEMTFEQFHTALDKRIQEDTTDKISKNLNTIKQCKKAGNTYVCTFNDRGFQSSVARFKKLDLMNGRFTLILKLTVKTENGKISNILLNGDRGDLVNLMQFVSTVTNIMQLFDPHIVDADGSMLALAKEMGIARGDSASNIGQAVVTIKPYAAVKCLTTMSSITTAQACEWVPRF